MFLIDDLTLSPARFVLWIFRQVHDAAKEEMHGQKQRITAELGQLHAMLESGRISEPEFDKLEALLLDRLDALDQQMADDGNDDAEEDDAEDGDDEDGGDEPAA